MEEKISCPKVFISYSWVVGDRVLGLAQRLMANGVEVVLDKWDLKPGHDKYAFMEQSVNDNSIGKVLVICDKSYCDKANLRTGGVGDETVIITAEVYGQVKQEKFIPIVFERDSEGKECIPHYIKSKIYIDLSEDNVEYEKHFEILLRDIYNCPSFPKPTLGQRPDWLDLEEKEYSSVHDTIKQLRACKPENKTKVAILIKRAESDIVDALKSFSLSESKSYDDALLDVIGQMRLLRDLIIDYIIALLESGFSVVESVITLIESMYNETHRDHMYGIQHYMVEAYDFFIWELFISITALFLHYEQYEMVRELLQHSYFLQKKGFDALEPGYYGRFYHVCNVIEKTCKPKYKNPRILTLQGELLVQRERKPILTKESLSNADLVLFQMYSILAKSEPRTDNWFPLSYLYHDEHQNFWVRLASRKYCYKLMPLFGAETIERLKELIKLSNETPNRLRFPNSGEYPQKIGDSIRSERIGLLD